MAKKEQEADPWVGPVTIARQIDCGSEHARMLILGGAFGERIDVAKLGAARASWRVRQSAVDAWIVTRKAGRRYHEEAAS